MKHIKTYEFNKWGNKSKQIEKFVEFIYDFLTQILKNLDEKYVISYSSDRRNGNLAYYFEYELHLDYSRTGVLFDIKDLNKYFKFTLDFNIGRKYKFSDISDNLTDILLFIDNTIKAYDDGQQFGQPIRSLPEIMKELTIENFEISQNAKLYNL